MDNKITELLEALKNAKGTLSYISTQGAANHPGFNMVAKMNADAAITKIDAAISKATLGKGEI